MARTDDSRLRSLLGESIPDGGDASDTLFSDEEIEDYLDSTPDLDRAAYEGWRVKAARLANLVDTTEGNSNRKFSQLVDNANDMIKLYAKSSGGTTEGRTRIGKIKRDPVQWQ